MKFWSVLALLGVLMFCTGCSITIPESGWHRGHITDLSTAGVFCQTFEGQVMTGSGNSSIAYNFTVTSQEVFDKLKAAQEANIEVNLKYNSPLLRSWCSSLNGNFVTDVALLNGLTLKHTSSTLDVPDSN